MRLALLFAPCAIAALVAACSAQSNESASTPDAAPCPATCGGACTDTDSDPANCGGCGHSCHGGTCSLGACDPVVVATEAPVGPGRELRSLRLSDGFLYWFEKGPDGASIRRCSVAGCPSGATVLASGQLDYLLAVAGSKAYFHSADGIVSCPIDGCGTSAPAVVVPASVLPLSIESLATDGIHMYWTDPSSVQTCLISGCVPTTLDTADGGSIGPAPWVVTDGSDVFWSFTSGLRGCAVGECMPSRAFPAADELTVANGVLAMFGADFMTVCPESSCADGADVRWGYSPEVAGLVIGSLAADEATAYFGACPMPLDPPSRKGTCAIQTLPLHGPTSRPQTLVALEDAPRDLAVDATSVYWIDAERGTVMRFPK